MRWPALLVAVGLATLCFGSGSVDAGPSSSKSSSAKRTAKRSNDKGTTRQCAERNGKKKCRRVATFQGRNASKSTLRTEDLPRPSGDVWLRAENLNEEVQVNIYKPDGTYDEGSLARLDELFRCKQTGEVRAVRPELYEQLSRIYDHFAGKRVDLVSGFRFAERNSSRHFHASAMDIRISGVSIRDMYRYAESLDGGNMGIGLYPNSNFIHVDFRAPGEPSYRWTDLSGPNSGRGKKAKKKSTGRTHPARKPVS
ncbi:MAG: YcbK family protein [Deltaproteobacteria bacterium]|nr:YcbK family protein [Deltaproteobacteria bacterium]MDQ3298808.1 DUF882 domain-containing protein [Myxococcota bacterium]